MKTDSKKRQTGSRSLPLECPLTDPLPPTRRRLFQLPVWSLLFLAAFLALGVTSRAQDAPKVLFIGGQDEPAQGADGAVWDMMIEWWGEENLTYLGSGASTTEDAEGHDVVVLSSTPGSGSIRNKFHEVEVGVLNWEEALGRTVSQGEMGIVTASGNRQKYTTITEISIEDNSHPITDGLSLGTFQLLENTAEIWGSQWGATLDSTDPIADEILAPGATILANIPKEATEDAGFDFRNAAIVAVAQGDPLWLADGEPIPAPGNRLMFPLTDNTANELTEDGWNLLKRSIEWTAGVLTAGGGIDPTLVAWWPLTEGSGEDLVDSTGNNTTAELVDAEWIPADDGDNVPDFLAGASVPSFDGNASFALLGEGLIPVMDETTAFSIAFWTNQVGGGTGVNEIVLGNRWNIDGVDDAPREFIKFTPTKFEFHQDGNGNENVEYGDAGPLPDDIWTHHAIVKDGLLFTYYRDGVESNSYENTGAFPLNAQPLFIGGQLPGNGEHWSGSLADIGVWERSLSAADVATIAADGIAALGGGAGPSALLTFNEGEELPEGIEFVGVGEIRDEGGLDDTGYLKVTDAANGEFGAVVFPDLLDGKAVKSFKFTADFRVGGGTDRPADGFSVNLVRPDDPLLSDPIGDFASFAPSPNNAEASLPEEGSTTGLGIGFDEWDSGAPDVVGFSVRVDGELVTQVEAGVLNGEADDVESLQTGPIGPDGPGDISELTWQPFEVDLAEDGKLTIKWKGKTVLDAFQTTFFPSPVQIVFAGRTGGANAAHHVDNIGLSIQPLDLLVVSRVTSSTTGLIFELTNSDESVLNQETIGLKVDGETVTPTVTDGEEGKILITFVAPEAYSPGTTHTYELTANDMNGNAAVRSGAGEFKLKDTLMPFGIPLVGPEGEAGLWGVRYIWDAGTLGSTGAALDVLQRSDDADFEGQVFDTTSAFANLNEARPELFFESDPYPDEVLDGGGAVDDFMVSYKGTLKINSAGLYTFGYNTDDGAGLRIFGAEFISKGGGAVIDPVQPNSFVFTGTTGNTDSHAVVNLAVGTYPIEFFWFERGGGDKGVLYFAKGEYADDADADPGNAEDGMWELVGGDHLVGAGALPFQFTNIVKAGTDVTITWQSTEGAGYTIERATAEQFGAGEFEELQDGFEGQAGDTSSYTDSGVTDGEIYYRVKAE